MSLRQQLEGMAKTMRTRKGWAGELTKVHGDSLAHDFEVSAQYLESAAKAVAKQEKINNSVSSTLVRVSEYLSGSVDVVDGDYGVPAPNEAMSISVEVDEAIAMLEQKP